MLIKAEGNIRGHIRVRIKYFLIFDLIYL
jgi:hypothetical protein